MHWFIEGLRVAAIYGIPAGIFGALLGKSEKFLEIILEILLDILRSWL